MTSVHTVQCSLCCIWDLYIYCNVYTLLYMRSVHILYSIFCVIHEICTDYTVYTVLYMVLCAHVPQVGVHVFVSSIYSKDPLPVNRVYGHLYLYPVTLTILCIYFNLNKYNIILLQWLCNHRIFWHGRRGHVLAITTFSVILTYNDLKCFQHQQHNALIQHCCSYHNGTYLHCSHSLP